ncbi:hypothetical protein C2G38_2217488 [Gigaspora rosea]|uniref:Uncharacterized protein n=1 Tax=Gigaspora rosea TaxID=44941 RepID=A0A397UB07_9GLOM|nr:hypothetical protein C2G38_2217488 [Gigaspora rosea]
MKLVEELIKVFEPFDQATEVFSSNKYPTLLVVYPIIEVLKFEFAVDLSLFLAKNVDPIEKYESNLNSDRESEEDNDCLPETFHL